MPSPRVIILRAAGTNCDLETEHAWRLAGARPERIHLRRLLERPAALDEAQIVTIPGGFSYGDDLGAGTIFARQVARGLADELRRFAERGGLILGICNGFQILVKAGLLPFPEGAGAPRCTITFNDPPGFQDRWIALRGGATRCAFLEAGRVYEMPIAHGEGRVCFVDDGTRRAVLEGGCGAAVYCAAPGGADGPPNPNGSADDLAGLCDPTGRILGLMPHPERYVDPTQHPRWTCAADLPEHGDGLAIFRRAVAQIS